MSLYVDIGRGILAVTAPTVAVVCLAVWWRTADIVAATLNRNVTKLIMRRDRLNLRGAKRERLGASAASLHRALVERGLSPMGTIPRYSPPNVRQALLSSHAQILELDRGGGLDLPAVAAINHDAARRRTLRAREDEERGG